MVIPSNTVGNEWTVVVHIHHALLTRAAVMRPVRLDLFARKTELGTLKCTTLAQLIHFTSQLIVMYMFVVSIDTSIM